MTQQSTNMQRVKRAPDLFYDKVKMRFAINQRANDQQSYFPY